MLHDDSGQLSIDYIVGVSIFLITFIYVGAFIPGMLLPFQSTSDELTGMADRVSVALVMDYLVDDPSRPNVVNTTKLYNFLNNELDGSNISGTADKLGLRSSVKSYNLNVSLKYMNGTSRVNGTELPDFANIAQTKRVILINSTSNATAILAVRVWG